MYGHARISMGDRGFGPPPPDKSIINLDLLVDRLRQLKNKRKVSIHRISKLDMFLIYIDTVSFFLFAFVTEKEGFCKYFGSKKTGHEIETHP